MSMIDKLWDELTERILWHSLIKILKNKNIPTKLGKAQTKDAIDKYCKTKAGNLNVKSLVNDLEEYVLAGSKVVLIIRISKAQMESMKKSIHSVAITKTYSVDFPYSCKGKQVESLPLNQPQLIKKTSTPNGTSLVLCTKRKVRLKVDLKEEMAELNPDFIQQYDEIYGVSTQEILLHDVVHFNYEESLIHIRLDNFRKLAQREISNSRAIIEYYLNEHFDLNDFEYVNFYPVMAKVYDKAKLGRIVEYGFSTDTFSIKHERERKFGQDLRLENYHMNGKKAVPKIIPYCMGARWTKTAYGDHEYELLLPGTERLVYDIAPHIHEAYLFHCLHESDLDFLSKILLKFSA